MTNAEWRMTKRPLIAAIGDSTTAGTPGFLSPREAPPDGRGDITSQYAYWLMKSHPDWTVINLGINGQRSDEIRARFDDEVIATKPAVAVIIAGVNDVYQGRHADHVKHELSAMYEAAHYAGIAVVAGTIVPFDTATAEQNARMREINAWIEDEAHGTAWMAFADTRAAVASPSDPDRLRSSPDQLHPDADGYRRMAEALSPAIERLLSPRSAHL